MKVFLDTTYLLPAIGISIDLPEELIEKLFLSNHLLIISQLSLFELFGKASKYFPNAKKRFYEGMKSILASKIEVKPILSLDNLSKVIEIHEKIKDLADCIIVASAMTYADILLSEAKDIQKVITDFKILDLKKFARKYL